MQMRAIWLQSCKRWTKIFCRVPCGVSGKAGGRYYSWGFVFIKEKSGNFLKERSSATTLCTCVIVSRDSTSGETDRPCDDSCHWSTSFHVRLKLDSTSSEPIRVRATGLDKWIGCIGHKWRPQKRGKGACVWESERDRITFLGYIQFISVLSTTRFLLFPLNGGM